MTGVDQHLDVERIKDGLDTSHLAFHKILIKSLPHIATLMVVFDGVVPFVHIQNLCRIEVGIEQVGRVGVVFGHVVDIDASAVGDGVQNRIEGDVEIPVLSVYVLVGGVQYVLLNFSPFLVIQQSEIIGVFAHHSNSVER